MTPAERRARMQELNKIRWAGHVAKKPGSARQYAPEKTLSVTIVGHLVPYIQEQCHQRDMTPHKFVTDLIHCWRMDQTKRETVPNGLGVAIREEPNEFPVHIPTKAVRYA